MLNVPKFVIQTEGKAVLDLKASLPSGWLFSVGTLAIVLFGITAASAPNAYSQTGSTSTRKEMSSEELLALRQLPEEAKALSIEDLSQGWADYNVTAEAIEFWATRYYELTGTRPTIAKDLVELVRDHGDAVIQLHEAPIRIGITTYSAREFDKAAAKQLIGALLRSLEAQGISLSDVAIVSGLTNLGGVQAAYEAASLYPAVERQGIASGKGILHETAQVDKAVLVGVEWGAESPLFLNTVNFMVGIGGGGQAESELRWYIKRSPDRTILAEGFFERKGEQSISGATDRVAESRMGTVFENAALHPIEVGQHIGEHLGQVYRQSQFQDDSNVLLSLALPRQPDNVVDIEAWAEAHRQRYRVIRILRAVEANANTDGLTESEINDFLLELGGALINRTSSIDHINQNELWQQEAKTIIQESVASSGHSQLETLASSIEIDILFASWFGQQEISAEPSFYDIHVRSLSPEELLRPSSDDLSFDLRDYVELRFDLATRAYLLSSAGRGEVFIGSKHDMDLYYRSQGFEPAQRISDSNGTVFYLLKRDSERLFVAQGVDSPARLTQVLSMMSAAGVDVPEKISIRGDLDRMRALNRDFLEVAIANLGKPALGVVIGDKNHVVTAISERLSVSTDELRVLPTQQVGPFRFEVIEVQSQGMATSGYVVAFAPAYGELSYDLTTAAYRAGVRNFFFAGAGGVMVPGGAIGETRLITTSEVNGELIDMSELSEVILLEMPGAALSNNVFSPSPLEQTTAWLDSQRSRGLQTTDQEIGQVFKAIVDAIAVDKDMGISPQVSLSPGLYISDDFSGRLAAGTVDSNYRQAIHTRMLHFLDQTGTTAVLTTEGQSIPWAGPLTQPTSHHRAGRFTIDHQLPIPASSRVSQNQAAGSIQQFRGEKRVIYVDTMEMGPRDRSFLKEFLSSLRPSQFWVVARQSDPNHAEILQISSSLGFENILISSSNQLQVAPDFVYSVTDVESEANVAMQFIQDGKNDPYETNTANHFQLVLGSKGLTYTTSGPNVLYSADLSPIDAEELAEPIRREVRQARKRVIQDIETHLGSEGAPRFLELDEINEALEGRTPISIMGASKKAWPNISPQNQAEVREFIENYLNQLNPQAHVIVTGGTEFGVEAVVHEVAHQMGFEIFSTITENTAASELSPHVSHVVVTGINWFGISRSLFQDVIKPHHGEVIFIGGGQILRDSIELAAKMQVPFRLMSGPEGAANDLASTYPALTFTDLKGLNSIQQSSTSNLSCEAMLKLIPRRRAR